MEKPIQSSAAQMIVTMSAPQSQPSSLLRSRRPIRGPAQMPRRRPALCSEIPSNLGMPAWMQLPSGFCSVAH